MISIYIIPLIAAMFLAINMGGSGTAPSFAAAHGSGLIRKDLIPGLFGVFVFLGALLGGQKVILTMGSDILPSQNVTMVVSVIILLSVGLALFFANMLNVPQSTSQAAVFALAGPALYFGVLQHNRLLLEIIPTWFISPLIAFALSYGLARLLYMPMKSRFQSILLYLEKSRLVPFIVIATACYVAFAIGANNIANAAAPVLSLAANVLQFEVGSPDFFLVMLIVVLMLAPMFGLGSSFLGHRVLKTTGKEITAMGPLGASYISLITASILLFISLWRGIPASLVQMNTAAIIGLGMYKNGRAHTLDNTPLRRIFTIWIVSPLIALFLSLFFTWLADNAGVL